MLFPLTNPAGEGIMILPNPSKNWRKQGIPEGAENMYKRTSQGWIKHLDFILWDLLSLQIAFFLAFILREHHFNPYVKPLYRNMGLYLTAVDFLIILAMDTMHDVLKLGHWRNFKITLEHTLILIALAIMFLFFSKTGQRYSRLNMVYLFTSYLLLSYGTRELWKAVLHRNLGRLSQRSLLILADSRAAGDVVKAMQDNNYPSLALHGVALLDEAPDLTDIRGIPVVARGKDLISYACHTWVDEVLVVPSEAAAYPREITDALQQMGITVHLSLSQVAGSLGGKKFVEKIGPFPCLTSTLNYASPMALFAKRAMDIAGGLIGCLLTGIIYLFVAPAIYKASPGPIFFAQTRVGKNGRTFKMYKFRSMYLDAEARKAELMKDNKLGDGKMFKLDFDPRVIGNEILPDGTRKTGIGDFIRRTSLDEFPQFFNVLKGDMSIVGTRPPLPSETQLYELHHYARLAIKPGVTGMWQISGRSDITDFEEVVRLDKSYIENWSLGLDIKILLKTIWVVFREDGSV